MPVFLFILVGVYVLSRLVDGVGRKTFLGLVTFLGFSTCYLCCNWGANISVERASAQRLKPVCLQVIAKEERHQPQGVAELRLPTDISQVRFKWQKHSSVACRFLDNGTIVVTESLVESVRLLQLLKFADPKAAKHAATPHGQMLVAQLMGSPPPPGSTL